jgi:hypothetical protein
MAKQMSDGSWQDSDGRSFLSEHDANNSYSSDKAFNDMLGLTAVVGFFAILFIKLYIWLLKKGIIPCLGIAGGVAAFIGIPYGLITKTSFMGTAAGAWWIIFLVVYIVSLIAWNKKLIKILIPMGVMVVITVAWISLLSFEVINVPDYMWISRMPENHANAKEVDSIKYNENAAGDGIIIVKYGGKKINIKFDKESKPTLKSRYDGINGGTVVIPDEFNGLPVTGINDRAFERKDVLQVTLPKNLKYIGDHAFAFSGLTSVIIPEGVTDIAEGAFTGCANLTEVRFPKSLKRIGVSAFNGTPVENEMKKLPSTVKRGMYYKNKPDNSVHVNGMDRFFLEGTGMPTYNQTN